MVVLDLPCYPVSFRQWKPVSCGCPEFSLLEIEMQAHGWLRAANTRAYEASDPAFFNPKKSFLLFFLILFILGLFGWGCSGGIGPAARGFGLPGTNGASAPNSTTAPVPMVAPSNAVSLMHFGNAGFGGDDTNVIQTALNYTAANGQTLEIPAGNYNVNPLSFPNNADVFVDAGVTVTAVSGYGSGSKMLNINASNVRLAGAGASVSVFQMRKQEYTSGESRHCLDIQGLQNAIISNVTISGISCNDSGGDGLYIRQASNVTVQDSIFDNNRRQGSSITGQVNHILYLRDHFTNTNGTAPQAGVDIEPNQPQDFLLDVKILDCHTDANAGDGLMVSTWLMDATSQPIDVTVLRNHATGNGRFGYSGQNNDPSNAPGTILIQDSVSDQSGSYGAAGYFYEASGAALIFQNLTITNPHMNGPSIYGDSAAVGVVRGGGGAGPLGNVHFLNVNIAITNGKTDRYFYFWDGGGSGVQNVEFVPGSLSGATSTPPLGLLQGVGTNAIN